MVQPVAVPSVAPALAQHVGMGAIPYTGGVTFRVWSMFADRCLWLGSLMGGRRRPLRSPETGRATTGRWMCRERRWGRLISLFCLMRRSLGEIRSGWIRMRGRSSRMRTTILNAIVASRDTPYEGGTYTTPLWNEAVSYELHIPTFNGTAGSPGTFDTAMMRFRI